MFQPWPVWLGWLEPRPIDWGVAGSILGQGAYEKATNQCFSRWSRLSKHRHFVRSRGFSVKRSWVQIFTLTFISDETLSKLTLTSQSYNLLICKMGRVIATSYVCKTLHIGKVFLFF